MAKRATLSAEEVIDNLDESFDFTNYEDWEGLDGVQEPINAGSDDEFSDLEERLEEEEEEYYDRLEVEVVSNMMPEQGVGEREESQETGDEMETDTNVTQGENGSRNRDELLHTYM